MNLLRKIYHQIRKRKLLNSFKKDKKKLNLIEKVDTIEDIDDVYFGFFGEFGYEMVSWLPFLTYISETYNIKLNTISRKGSKIFYEKISKNHIEVEVEYFGTIWGEIELIKKLPVNKKMVTPNNKYLNYLNIKIIDSFWENKNIHSILKTNFFSPPVIINKSNILDKYINTSKIVTINNKNHYNWNYTLVKNFYTQEEVETLINFLIKNNYSVIYNNPNRLVTDIFEMNDEDKISLNSLEKSKVIDLNKIDNNDIELRNKLQVEAWAKSDFIIGIHGGSVYVPSILKKKQLILMRKGEYIDFAELNRVFESDISLFYEVDNIIDYLKCRIINKI